MPYQSSLLYWEYLHYTTLVSIIFLLFSECFFLTVVSVMRWPSSVSWKLILWKDFRYFRCIYPVIIYIMNSIKNMWYISSFFQFILCLFDIEYSLDEGQELCCLTLYHQYHEKASDTWTAFLINIWELNSICNFTN